MTKEIYIQWLENMIQGCVDLQGLDIEKAIYQQCLKEARKIGQPSPTDSVSIITVEQAIKDLKKSGKKLRRLIFNLPKDNDKGHKELIDYIECLEKQLEAKQGQNSKLEERNDLLSCLYPGL